MSDNWVDVGLVGDFTPGKTRIIDIDDVMVAVFNIAGEFFAIENVCTHDGSPLIMEELDPALQIQGSEITCPHHGAVFCIKTGAALSPPAYEATAVFTTRVEAEMVQVKATSDS